MMKFGKLIDLDELESKSDRSSETDIESAIQVYIMTEVIEHL